ncbi:hypothetical protein [Leadbetterella sp. DM7]|uniref:hypothetical protein n=1 Tax=Leadbetterella sp. DM7 TaxID=3235085 RepID=UPI00349E4C0F
MDTIKIHFFKQEESPEKKRVRFYQQFKKDSKPSYFDLSADVPYTITDNDPHATPDNPLTLVLNKKDHGYSEKFQIMAFASPDTTDFHPPTTIFRIQYGNSDHVLVGRIFDNSIFSRLDG